MKTIDFVCFSISRKWFVYCYRVLRKSYNHNHSKSHTHPTDSHERVRMISKFQQGGAYRMIVIYHVPHPQLENYWQSVHGISAVESRRQLLCLHSQHILAAGEIINCRRFHPQRSHPKLPSFVADVTSNPSTTLVDALVLKR